MDSDHGSGIDHISGLPDELLQDILLRLDLTTPAAAARTSVLSHRWHHVWGSLPDLFFGESAEDPQPNYSLDAIDGALAAYSAPKLSSLYITTPTDNELRVPAYRVASWLAFASRHLVDSLYLDIYHTSSYAEEDELELPTCETATEIDLRLPFILRHRRNDIAVFTALTDLNIRGATIDGRELEGLVSRLCPRLKNLDLFVKFSAESNISIHSATLEQLSFIVEKARRLEVKAPILRRLVAGYPVQTYVAAPNLSEVVWDDFAGEEELKFIFADSGCRLRLLDVRDCSTMVPLMRCFDTVDELKLHGLSLGTEEGYQSFLDDIEHLPRCEVLHVSSFMGHRCFVPGILHLLKRVHGVRKLVFDNDPVKFYPSLSACPCRLLEGDMAGEINLCSVEEIEINRFSGANEQMKLIDVLTSRCSVAKLQRLEITLTDDVTQLSEEVCEKIQIMCGPGVEVNIYEV